MGWFIFLQIILHFSKKILIFAAKLKNVNNYE
jgi:hypothetical protein